MDLLTNIIVGIVMLIIGFFIDRIWEWNKKRQTGLTGKAHSMIKKLGNAVQSYEGNYFLSNTPNDNYKIVKHVYENSVGEIISTSFRENPNYGERDLSRLLPKGVSFTRLTSESICPKKDLLNAREVLKSIVPNSQILAIPAAHLITSIDGIFVELTDKTYITFLTFPKTGENQHIRGIIFYGNTAKAFFDYYNDLKVSVGI